MHRLTKNYCRIIILMALVLSLLFLTWKMGILLGNVRNHYGKSLNRVFQVNVRKNLGNHFKSLMEPGGKKKTENDPGSMAKGRPSGEQKHRKIEINIKDTPTNLSGAKESKRERKTLIKENNDAVLKPANLSETRNNLKEIKTASATSPLPPSTAPTTLPIPITLQYSWSDVYGESGCSPNPWRTILVELFTEWVKMAKKHNIEYILFYGSLLGALRTGDVIPYDSDIDLLMDVKYFPKMKEIAATRGFDVSDGKIRLVVQPEFDHDVPSNKRKRYTCNGKLTPSMVDGCSFQEPLGRLVKKYLHIDFYHFYDKGNSLEDPSEEDLKTYDKKDMFPLRPCKFMGLDTFCPNKPWKLLKKYFHSDNLESKYKCKNKRWVDKNGNAS